MINKNLVLRIFQSLGFSFVTPINNFTMGPTDLVKSLNIRNFSREILVCQFLNQLVPLLGTEKRLLTVAIVGGDLTEPEFQALQKLDFILSVTVLGVEMTGDSFLDLNIAPSKTQRIFDIVICSQVLEHVWNINSAFRNIDSLLGPNSFVWISSPASNRFHGSPQYFFAGFSRDLLGKMAVKFGFHDVQTGSFGTHRNYLATHSLDVWLSPRGHSFPLLFAFESKPLLVRLVLTLRFSLRLIYLSFLSGKLTSNPRYATESWIFARKMN